MLQPRRIIEGVFVGVDKFPAIDFKEFTVKHDAAMLLQQCLFFSQQFAQAVKAGFEAVACTGGFDAGPGRLHYLLAAQAFAAGCDQLQQQRNQNPWRFFAALLSRCNVQSAEGEDLFFAAIGRAGCPQEIG